MIYDVHAYIDFYDDRNSVISYIESKKIYTIAVTNLPKLYKKYQNEYLSLKYIRFALGFHPELVLKYYSQIDEFIELLPHVKYIGEIGLDFSQGKSFIDKDMQLKVFNKIILHCKKCMEKKILSIHSRNAAKEVASIVNNYHGRVIMHWFSGNITDLNVAINAGYYFSINNQMVDSDKGRKIIEQIPEDRILTETDAPFSRMTKSGYCLESINYVYKQLSLIKKTGYDNIIKILTNNFYSVIKG
jgi:TatD DNase family protein